MLLAYSSSDGRFGAVSMIRNHGEIASMPPDSVRTRLVSKYSEAIGENAEMISINSRLVIAGQVLALRGTVCIGGVLLVWL